MSLTVLSTVAAIIPFSDLLSGVADKIKIEHCVATSPDTVADAIDAFPHSNILYTGEAPSRWPKNWKIEWVQFHFAGIDYTPFDNIPNSVPITTASGIHASVAAEHAFALILALRRRLPFILDLQRNVRWPQQRWQEFSLPLLRGQTLGVIGYGSIGREIGRLGKSFGMRILACKRTPQQTKDNGYTPVGIGDPDGLLPDTIFGIEDICSLVSQSDVVVASLPLTPATEKIVNSLTFEAMKPNTIFINIGRGKTVDEVALIDAMRSQKALLAGLDVFTEEPLPLSSPLWKLDNVIVSPHASTLFSNYGYAAVELFSENLRRFILRDPLLNIFQRDSQY